MRRHGSRRDSSTPWVSATVFGATSATLPLLLAVYLALAGILGGPFYETLCEAVEAEELGRPAPTHGRGFLSALLAGVGVECGNFVVSFAGGIVAFAVSFAFPPFGAFAAAGIAWALAGFGYLVYPFDRLATPLRAKLATVSKRLDVALGFGAAVYVLLIPIVTVPFVAPCAVAGAALLFPGGSKRDEA
jgi:CysZ protein